jgi:hypothetical protein
LTRNDPPCADKLAHGLCPGAEFKPFRHLNNDLNRFLGIKRTL